MNLTGIFPPIITPFKENGDVDEEKFIRNIGRWNNQPLSGYLVLGSNSEAPFLSREEKLRLVELAVEHAAPDRTVIVGSGMESARETIRLTNDAALAGAQAALVLTPSYYGEQMTDEALASFFSAVADASSIPILVYNVPKFTHVNVSVDVLSRLQKHKNIIGMKDSSGNMPQLASFRKAIDPRFQILVGTASGWLPALEMGIKGGILALANCCGTECVRVRELYEAGKLKEAGDLNSRLLPVNKAVTSTYGVAGLKYACERRGFDSGTVRSPLLPLNADQKSRLDEILVTAGLV
ncbi:MAG: dihydrodipicolinate synthase family protein [Bacteroidota bacterium]